MVNAFRFVGTAMLLVVCVQPVEGAKRLGPPSAVLRAEQNRTAAVVAVGRESGAVEFELVAELHGEAPDRLRVRVGDETASRVEVGRTYVLCYTTLRRDPRGRSRDYQLDPRGPGIVEIPSIGEALFEDTPHVRALVRYGSGDAAGADSERLRAVLGQVTRAEPATRRFVLAELALRPTLIELADAAALDILREVLVSEGLGPEATLLLLQAVSPLVPRAELEWVAAECRRLLQEHERALDLASGVPAMLEMAAELLGRSGGAQDIELLEEHLYSNNPAVGRQAARSIVELDPVAGAEMVATALERGELHPDVIREIERQLAVL